jgi:hypothetical protein
MAWSRLAGILRFYRGGGKQTESWYVLSEAATKSLVTENREPREIHERFGRGFEIQDPAFAKRLPTSTVARNDTNNRVESANIGWMNWCTAK